MYLTREQILSAQDIERKAVDVPEWGGKVLVQALDGAGLSAYQSHIVKVKKVGKDMETSIHLDGVAVLLASLCIVDENGARLFSPADMEALGRKSAEALGRVVEVARELSGLTEDDDAESEAEKN